MTHLSHTRTYLRFPFSSPLILGGETYVCEGVLRNLSLQGCSIIADREFALNSIVRVGLLLPNQTRALTIEMSRVIWTQGPACGLEFMELSLVTRLLLGRTLRVTLIEFLNTRKRRECERPTVSPIYG